MTHNGFSRLSEAWDNLTELSGNYYLNLSDTPFPSNYPLPPKGFTILQGQAARDFLATEKAKWLAEHGEAQAPLPTPTPTPTPAPEPEPSYRAGDFNGDGRDDVLLRHDNGTVTEWLGKSNGGFSSNHAVASYGLDVRWQVAGTGDFNGDGRDDVLLRHDNGTVTDWLGQANGGFVSNHGNASYALPAGWGVAITGDFNGDGRDDVLLRHDNGTVTNWLGKANGGFVSNHAVANYPLDNGWHIEGVGDFNGDGRDDVLLRHDNGTVTDWLGQANGGFVSNHAKANYALPAGWDVVSSGDFNGDGRDDVLLRHDNGTVTNWLGQANGGFVSNHAVANYPLDDAWHIASVGDFNGDGRDDVLLRHDNGTVTDWLGQANGGFVSNHGAAIYPLDTAWHVQLDDLWM